MVKSQVLYLARDPWILGAALEWVWVDGKTVEAVEAAEPVSDCSSYQLLLHEH